MPLGSSEVWDDVEGPVLDPTSPAVGTPALPAGRGRGGRS